MFAKISILICLLIVPFTLATFPNGNQAITFVTGHNAYRTSVNPPARCLPVASWSWDISASANNWAQQCNFAHSGTPNLGENIYAISVRTPNASTFDPNGPVNAWGSERQFYNYATNTCASGQICGHYTQMVWDSSTVIGCAFQDCPTIRNVPFPNGGTIAVCQYSLPGNIVGQRPYCTSC